MSQVVTLIEDPETGDLNIILGPTQYSFVTDDAHIVQIIGPYLIIEPLHQLRRPPQEQLFSIKRYLDRNYPGLRIFRVMVP